MSTAPGKKQKNQLESQDLGASGGAEDITEGLRGLSLVSFLKVFMKKFLSNIVTGRGKP